MRNSRTTTEVQKTIYPKCNIKKQHDKQSLNLVCLTKTCKYHGPICALCKKDHINHNVVPIKTFITNLTQVCKPKLQTILQLKQDKQLKQKKQIKLNKQVKQTVKQVKQVKQISEVIAPQVIAPQVIVIEKTQTKPLQVATLQTQQKVCMQVTTFQKIQSSFIQIMSILKLQVIQLSEQIYKLQTKFLNQYQQIKHQLNEQQRKKQIIQEHLMFLKQKTFQNQFQFRNTIGKLIKIINVNKNQITIQKAQDNIVKSYCDKAEVYKDNLMALKSQLKHMFESINQKSIVEKLVENRPKTAMPNLNANTKIVFSPTLKAPNIILQSQGTIARLKDGLGDKFTILSNIVSTKVNQIIIKPIIQTGIIMFGICLKDKIKQKNYEFKKNAVGHGAFMIASNGMKYSHTEKTQNSLADNFTFEAHDQISITLDITTKKLIFKSKTKSAELNLKSLNQTLWKQLEFCAVLSAVGDKIQLV